MARRQSLEVQTENAVGLVALEPTWRGPRWSHLALQKGVCIGGTDYREIGFFLIRSPQIPTIQPPNCSS